MGVNVYKEWKESDTHSPWCWAESVSGVGGAVVISNEDEINDSTDFVEATWELTYYQLAEYFWGKVVRALRELGDPEDVRIVFWFDN